MKFSRRLAIQLLLGLLAVSNVAGCGHRVRAQIIEVMGDRVAVPEGSSFAAETYDWNPRFVVPLEPREVVRFYAESIPVMRDLDWDTSDFSAEEATAALEREGHIDLFFVRGDSQILYLVISAAPEAGQTMLSFEIWDV